MLSTLSETGKIYSKGVGAQGGAHFQYLEVYHGTPLELVTIKRLHYNSGGRYGGVDGLVDRAICTVLV